MASLAECSREPVSQIDVSMLSDSRFLVRSARKYAYRDAAGRVNLHLLRLARLEIDKDPDVPDDVHEKLHKWLRHAERWAERTRQVLLSALSGDVAGIVFTHLCNALEPRDAVAFSSASRWLWEPTQALRGQLRVEHEAAAALCRKVKTRDLRSVKELREAKEVFFFCRNLTMADLTTLGTLGLVLPALETLRFVEVSGSAGPEGVQRLAEGLGAGALPAVTSLTLKMHVGDAGASALAAALGRGALPRLESLVLFSTDIGDAGLVALAPALRRLPALEVVDLHGNPLGDEGLAALVAPRLLAGAPPPPAGGLAKLKRLHLNFTRITDAGCATLVAAFNSGALPSLEEISLYHAPASVMARNAAEQALARRRC